MLRESETEHSTLCKLAILKPRGKVMWTDNDNHCPRCKALEAYSQLQFTISNYPHTRYCFSWPIRIKSVDVISQEGHLLLSTCLHKVNTTLQSSSLSVSVAGHEA